MVELLITYWMGTHGPIHMEEFWFRYGDSAGFKETYYTAAGRDSR